MMTFSMPRARAASVPGRSCRNFSAREENQVTARIDDDELGAPLHAVGDPVAVEAVLAAGGRVLGPDDDHFRHLVLGIGHAVGEELAGIQDGVVAVGEHHGRQAGRVAGVTGQPQLHPVGAAEGVAEEGDGAADVAAGALGEDDRFRPVLLLDVVEALLDGVQGLVPADALELALAALPHPLQRMGEALGVIDVLGERQSPRAQAALVVGVVFVALHLDQAAVLDVELDAAAAVTAGTGRPGGRPYNAGSIHRAISLC